jgi:hypothetical protein
LKKKKRNHIQQESSGIPMTIIGLDVCDGISKWVDEQFKELAASGRTGRFVADSFCIIREYYSVQPDVHD